MKTKTLIPWLITSLLLCQANKLSQMYPHWNDFLAIRQQLDPQQLFINGYLRLLFGLDLPKA